ncbi:phosphotransferase [Catellatospora sp. IY07-71]|uniref:aminoglycoside phosphotransferase family protein n=1 Tax=Catellatospora sp. IY07-71 TaxID=2728827 RepID=UPI001BB437FE|nr:aminoglycoside phosphotransferase family protein [Catellatospora sp. IY07-71]BCJ76945.1 phosphotransferase [Catellatospora sp. IY07-71]
MRADEWAKAQDWIAETLAEQGIAATGPAVVDRVRPWSTTARVPVAGGQAWFKYNNAGSRYEAALMRLLAAIAPHDMLVPLAVDAELGWMLLPDGGPTMREITSDTFDRDRWEHLLRRYAELQRAAAPHAAGMLAAGVPDFRPHTVAAQYEKLLTDPYVLANLDAGKMAGLHEWVPRIERMCRRLAAGGIAPSVQHDDLHPSNVFADGDGGLRFFDFGDATVAHPFGSMLVVLRVVHRDAKVEHKDPLLYELRDRYLSAWTADGRDLAELRELCQDAIVVAKIGKALSYQRSLQDATEEALAEYGEGIYGWLEELLGPDVI